MLFSCHKPMRFSGHNFKRISCQTDMGFRVGLKWRLFTLMAICLHDFFRHTYIYMNYYPSGSSSVPKFARKKPGNAWLKIQVVPPPGFEPGTY